MAVLDGAAKPKAEVEFAILQPVRKLIILAAEMPAIKSLPQAQWQDRVRAVTAQESH